MTNKDLINMIENDTQTSMLVKQVLIKIISTSNSTVLSLVELEQHFEDTQKILKSKGIIEGT